jgi:hypothetical protein
VQNDDAKEMRFIAAVILTTVASVWLILRFFRGDPVVFRL